MAFIGSLGKVISNTVKNVGKILKDPVALATIAVMAWINPIGTLGYLASAAVYTAGMAAMNALAPSPQVPDFGGLNTNSYVNEVQNRTQTIRQPAQPRRVVYGKVRVGGTITFIATEGAKNKFLHVLITFTGHQINRFVQFRIDDLNISLSGSRVTTSRFKKDGKFLVNIVTGLGTANQNAHSQLYNAFGNVDTNFRQRGCANAACRFEFDDDAYPNGLPTVSAVIEGALVYDPRTSATSYSNNSALCIRDYLTNATYGMGLTVNEIDEDSFIQAANDCEDQIGLSNGKTENRYECNGSFTVDKSHKQIITELLSSCSGVLTYQDGKFTLRVGKPITGYAVSLNEDDFLSAVDVRTKTSIGEQYNEVKGTFTTPFENSYLPTDYPPVKSATFLAEDNNFVRTLDLPMPFTTSSATAQRLGKIALYRSRQQITLTSTFNLKAFNLKAGDICAVSFARYGFSNKLFEVASWTLTPIATESLGVEMMLREFNNNIYAWLAADDEVIFQIDNSTLPDPFSIKPPLLVVTQVVHTINQKATTVIEATVTARDLYSTTFEVDVQKQSPSLGTVISLGRSASNVFEYPDVATGDVWRVRARSRSNLGTASTFVSQDITILGKGSLVFPSNVADLSLNYVGNDAVLTWTPITDQDLSHYEIRYQNLTTGATFTNAIILASKVARPANSVRVAGLTGTYFCIAVDKYGNRSSTASSVVGIIDQNPVTSGFALVNTQVESDSATDFLGTKNDVYIFDDGVNTPTLRLQSSNLFDSLSGNFDDALGLFDGGSGNTSPEGTYEFVNHFDLGAKQLFRIVGTNITKTREDYGVYAGTGNPLTRAAVGGDNVVLQIATTDDDPAGTPTYTSFTDVTAADYAARAYKIRLKLTSELMLDGTRYYTPAVELASVTTHGAISTQNGQDIPSGTGSGGKIVTYGYQFRTLSGLGIAAQNMRSGEYYDITNKSAAGFTITFYDSADAVISRTFDYNATGIGRIVA